MVGTLNPFWLLLVGLILGWLIEWVIDWVYWRRRTIARTEYDALQLRANQWRTERDTATTLADRRSNEVSELQQRLQQLQQADQQSQASLSTAHTTLEQQQSELGVAKRLVKQQQVDLTAANELIARHEYTISTLNDTIAALQTAANRYQIEQTPPTLMRQPFAADAAAPAEQESLTEQEIGATTDQIVRDPLVDINGIGPVYQARLYAAGIFTFAQIAEQSAERLREVVAAKSWQDIEPAAWIDEAREFAKQVQAGTYGKGATHG